MEVFGSNSNWIHRWTIASCQEDSCQSFLWCAHPIVQFCSPQNGPCSSSACRSQARGDASLANKGKGGWGYACHLFLISTCLWVSCSWSSCSCHRNCLWTSLLYGVDHCLKIWWQSQSQSDTLCPGWLLFQTQYYLVWDDCVEILYCGELLGEMSI